ncbi:hypothetical protein [Paenibacillus sp.]|uniref:hypothetical protein n=1 Tax=Paenibacillus sp. TaxID=58172 RepID=UPI002D2636B5|nr:hypothetical protein [Paenibacillus sp.]HZG84236.1 hypothetical protein [Paenibacillus sp.]
MRTAAFWAAWMAASAAGYAFAGYFGHFPGGYTGENWKLIAAVVGLAFGLITGGVAGLLQWAVMKGFGLPGGGRWTLAHMAAFAATHAFLDARSGEEIGYIWVGLAGGALLGWLCALARREAPAMRWLWTLAGGSSWGAALLLSAWALHSPAETFREHHIYDGLAVGALNGAAFAALLAASQNLRNLRARSSANADTTFKPL